MGSLRSLLTDRAVYLKELEQELERTVREEATKSLLKVCRNGTEDEILSLLEKGADPRVVDKGGTSLVWYIIRKDCVKVLRHLKNAGIDVNEPSVYGFTPLMAASQMYNTETVDFFLKEGYDVNQIIPHEKDTCPGWTALTFAVGDAYPSQSSDQLETIELLLKNGADINIRDKQGHTILERAGNNDSIISLLKKYEIKKK